MPLLLCVSVEKFCCDVMKAHTTEVESSDRRGLRVLQALS